MNIQEQQLLTEQAQKLVSAGKIDLMSSSATAFFAVIMLNLNESFSFTRVPTAGVTANLEIVYNPHFLVNTIKNREQMKFLLMHEIMHIVLAHVLKSRKGNREHGKWNRAGDYVINLELKESGFDVLECALLDKKYSGMTTEEVYALLDDDDSDSHMDDLIDDGDSDSSGEPNESSQSDSSPVSAAKAALGDKEGKGDNPAAVSDDEAEQRIKDLIMGAHLQHTMQQGSNSTPGKLPASIERLISKWLNPVLPWQQILARFINNVDREDYSWRHLNRRMFSLGYYLPTLHSEHMDRLDFAIDVSGSIAEKEFRVFLSELVGILKRFNPKQVGVMQFDTYTRTVDVINSIKELEAIPYAGGGGTALHDTLRVFESSPAKALIIFTDGHLSTQLKVPTRPVVWCIYNNPNFKAPFGEVVHFDLKQLQKQHA